jgi:hypothetical protein
MEPKATLGSPFKRNGSNTAIMRITYPTATVGLDRFGWMEVWNADGDADDEQKILCRFFIYSKGIRINGRSVSLRR